jgi:transcriptional regulator with XRE-family HTH domain
VTYYVIYLLTYDKDVLYFKNKKGGEKVENRFKEYRIAAGLSLSAVADSLKTTTRTVLRWERGDYEPSASALKEMALLYKTTLDALLANPTPPSTRAPKGPRAKRKAVNA